MFPSIVKDSINKAILYVPGPKAAHVLQGGVDGDLSQLTFMNGVTTKVFGIKDVRITRCGYTGEDGFEVKEVFLQYNVTGFRYIIGC